MQDQALDSVLSNSLVGNQYVPPDTKTSKKEKARRRKAQAEKTAGKGWFVDSLMIIYFFFENITKI